LIILKISTKIKQKSVILHYNVIVK